MNESCHVWMSHVQTSPPATIDGSCHTWMGHVTHEWVMSHMNGSCHIYTSNVTNKWVMSRMNESCPDQPSCNNKCSTWHTKKRHVTRYRVAKTHRMPWRAASGRALTPIPAARHRGRTTGPEDFSEPPFPVISRYFPTFLEVERLLILKSVFSWSPISKWGECVRIGKCNQIG